MPSPPLPLHVCYILRACVLYTRVQHVSYTLNTQGNMSHVYATSRTWQKACRKDDGGRGLIASYSTHVRIFVDMHSHSCTRLCALLSVYKRLRVCVSTFMFVDMRLCTCLCTCLCTSLCTALCTSLCTCLCTRVHIQAHSLYSIFTLYRHLSEHVCTFVHAQAYGQVHTCA